jgi:flagellar basal-body rod protein FlgC
MSFFRIFDTAGSGMSAQSVRLNTTASNLANADSVASTPEGAYRAKEPVFAAIQHGIGRNAQTGGVAVVGVSESQQPIGSRFEPGNPLANSDGYVFTPNVNPVDELVNMISASRAYQNDVEVMNSAKQLMLKTLELGK